ncbi:MAG: hypothetical protein M0R66_04200 [Candidatus Omnitrophica bacterium]|nr:hypothetical protein [Candidatus Omnitrophota bacterium]
MKKATLFILSLSAACLLAGIVTGALLNKSYTRKHMSRVIKAYYLNTPTQERQKANFDEFMNMLKTKLGLSPEQANEVEEIIRQEKPGMLSAIEKFKDETTVIRKRIATEIYPNLNQQQQEKFKKILSDTNLELNLPSPVSP